MIYLKIYHAIYYRFTTPENRLGFHDGSVHRDVIGE
jgi:hypothetical protein